MRHFARLNLDTSDQIQHNTGIILYRTGNTPAEAFETEHVKKKSFPNVTVFSCNQAGVEGVHNIPGTVLCKNSLFM
jgi:hypothetical protein